MNSVSKGVIRLVFLVVAATTATACGLMKQRTPQSEDVRIAEVRRSIHCGTEQRHAALSYFPTADDLMGWQADRGVDLVDRDRLPDGPLLLVEMGRRTSGGYFVEPKLDATIDRDRMMWLAGRWIEPGADRLTAQMLTSPCVLLSVPPRDYRGFRIIDQNEELRASTNLG